MSWILYYTMLWVWFINLNSKIINRLDNSDSVTKCLYCQCCLLVLPVLFVFLYYCIYSTSRVIITKALAVLCSGFLNLILILLQPFVGTRALQWSIREHAFNITSGMKSVNSGNCNANELSFNPQVIYHLYVELKWWKLKT